MQELGNVHAITCGAKALRSWRPHSGARFLAFQLLKIEVSRPDSKSVL